MSITTGAVNLSDDSLFEVGDPRVLSGSSAAKKRPLLRESPTHSAADRRVRV